MLHPSPFTPLPPMHWQLEYATLNTTYHSAPACTLPCHAPMVLPRGEVWPLALAPSTLLLPLTRTLLLLHSLPPLCGPSPPLQVNRQVFESSKGRLKVVGRAGVGVDNVDLAAATEVRGCPTAAHTRVKGQQALRGMAAASAP